MSADAQKLFRLEKDSIPLMRGFQLSFDLFGAGQMMLGDYGQYEAALRLNLHDQWFPIVELGYGKANHEEDAITGMAYKTQAPYFRVGIDFNMLKKKHQANRLFLGFRYANTSYKVDAHEIRRSRRAMLTALVGSGGWHRRPDIRSCPLRMERTLQKALGPQRRHHRQDLVRPRLRLVGFVSAGRVVQFHHRHLNTYETEEMVVAITPARAAHRRQHTHHPPAAVHALSA